MNTSRDTREVSSSVQSHHANTAPGCALLWEDDDISRYQRETGFQNSIAICAKRNAGWHPNNRLPHEVATALPLFQAFISEQPVWVFCIMAPLCWTSSQTLPCRSLWCRCCLTYFTHPEAAHCSWGQLFQACFTTHIQSIPSIGHDPQTLSSLRSFFTLKLAQLVCPDPLLCPWGQRWCRGQHDTVCRMNFELQHSTFKSSCWVKVNICMCFLRKPTWTSSLMQTYKSNSLVVQTRD